MHTPSACHFGRCHPGLTMMGPEQLPSCLGVPVEILPRDGANSNRCFAGRMGSPVEFRTGSAKTQGCA